MLITILIGITVLAFVGFGLYFLIPRLKKKKQPEQYQEPAVIDGKKTIDEQKRIVRVNKKKIGLVIPKIYEQELQKLEVLSNDEINELTGELANSIAQDTEKFLKYYTERTRKIDINKPNYTGFLLMKFKDDPKNDDYLYSATIVKVTTTTGNLPTNEEIQEKANALQLELENHTED